MSLHVQQEESVSASDKHSLTRQTLTHCVTFSCPVTHSSVGVPDYSLTEDAWLIYGVDDACETTMFSVNITVESQQKSVA